jgi:2-succinyl-5-enolpyruvyl-6-hydroxy-3-cyclohexene-1-carboxylate synthase
VGDVSFLHDLTGLAAARFAERPFVVVVAQNRGGRIFEQLPLATDPAGRGAVLDHWTTPHDHDLAGAAALYHLPFERATTPGELEEALRRGLERPGATVIEAVVPPHGAAEESRRVRQRVESAVAEVAARSGG